MYLKDRAETPSSQYLGRLGVPDGYELLSNHRQHLNTDAVELIKTAPGTRLGQSREELAHHLVVKVIWAVEDDTLFGQALGQVLGGLGLACTSRPSRGSPQVQLQGSHQAQVATILWDEIGDNKLL